MLSTSVPSFVGRKSAPSFVGQKSALSFVGKSARMRRMLKLRILNRRIHYKEREHDHVHSILNRRLRYREKEQKHA